MTTHPAPELIRDTIRQQLKRTKIAPTTQATVMDIVNRATRFKSRIDPVSNQKMDKVIGTMCNMLSLGWMQLCSRSRKRELMNARKMTIWIIRKEYSFITLSDIGRKFSRDHATIINNLASVKRLLEIKDPVMVELMELYYKAKTKACDQS